MLITQSPAAMSGFGGSFSVSRGQGSCGMSTEPVQERADCTMSGCLPTESLNMRVLMCVFGFLRTLSYIAL